jgi:hypothetical protein
MIRNYNIEWYPTRDGVEFKRSSFIRLSKPTGKTEYDAKAALNIFTASCGNLKKNTIVKIIEMDENGQIGEPIKPTEENAIIPIKKK